jgi:hypothetical protein
MEVSVMKKVVCILVLLLFLAVGLAFAGEAGNAPSMAPKQQAQQGIMTNAIPHMQQQQGIPDEPKDLHAAASSSTQIDLDWSYEASTEDGFVIERKTGSNGVYEVIYANDRTNLSYEDTQVEPNKTYFYRVRAFNRDGYTEPCKEVKATTPF